MDRRLFDRYLGNALYEARVVKRITQSEISKKANEVWLNKYSPNRKKGASRSTYTRYESGEISMPMGFFKSACDVLGLDWRKVFSEAQHYEMNHIDELKD